jgi:hypothetical protein
VLQPHGHPRPEQWQTSLPKASARAHWLRRECVSYLGICRNQLHVDVIKQTVKAMIVTELVDQARSLILSVAIHVPVWDYAH